MWTERSWLKILQSASLSSFSTFLSLILHFLLPSFLSFVPLPSNVFLFFFLFLFLSLSFSQHGHWQLIRFQLRARDFSGHKRYKHKYHWKTTDRHTRKKASCGMRFCGNTKEDGLILIRASERIHFVSKVTERDRQRSKKHFKPKKQQE